ncbi:hypothetical protein ACFVAO_20645 [Streptomyces californicus]|uniref:hypothetical protein n=1 Tax=Streptomyces californicus TaxID=67351 RepID=UPI0036CE3C1C
MKSTVIERRAELLRLYTGLPWQSARRRVEAAVPGSPLIHQPDAPQSLLEAGVMSAVAWRRISTVHPWGIEYVDPRSDRLLIRFEADPDMRRYQHETQALDLAQALLPRADEYGEIYGIPGARARVEDGLVVLRLLGTTASVTLLGLDPEEWLHAVDVQDQELSTEGMTLCHRDQPNRLHSAERPYLRAGRRADAMSAWLTSGLLRRVGLIRTLGVPLAVTGWVGHHEGAGERWIIDPMFEGGQGANGHRRLMALLAAPGWGLPVALRDAHCNCHMPPGHDQCTTTLAGTSERPGVLEVRAIQRRGSRLARIQQDCPEFYAARQQLVRSVPAWVERWLERSTASYAAPR